MSAARGRSGGGATILVVDDEITFARLIRDHLERTGHHTLGADSAESALELLRGKSPDLMLVDVHMPHMTGLELVQRLSQEDRLPPTIVMSAYGQLDTALQAVRCGAVDFLSKPFRLPEVELKVELALEKARLDGSPRRASGERPAVRPEAQSPEVFHNMIGRSAVMHELFTKIERVARFSSTVLIHGESGTGKELVARALHRASPRRGQPFVAVNCGAIPGNLLESELFGHVRGAFTDATADRQGLFEQADGGTLFLDEIVDLPLHLQVKLLRVLQEGEVRPVGANRPVPVDVRVLGASAVSARERVSQGRFREDLFYRLSVIDLQVPALRDRVQDIPLLVQFIVSRANERLGTDVTGVHPHAMARLMAYGWPGNVRELQNAIEQACVMSETPEIRAEGLASQIGAAPEPERPATAELTLPADSLSIPRAVQATERALIEAALSRTGGNRTHAALLLEISQRSLLTKIARYEVDIPGQPGRPPRR
ncbi:MAG: sigma-54-dependent Fis family transcriptional regulator [Myxococcales bacterium]|nr:sigma-54-dependent Fis family transcriptional regulator [Myxococcales bacterium]